MPAPHKCQHHLATAIALGLKLPALPGSHAWETHIHPALGDLPGSPYDELILGPYPDQASALRALAQWIVCHWADLAAAGLDAPWADNNPDTWLSTKTDADIVNLFFVGNPEDSYTIRRITIAQPLPTNMPLTLAEITNPHGNSPHGRR
jgi:hypothetical protein